MKEYEYYIDEAHPEILYRYDIFRNVHVIVFPEPSSPWVHDGHPSHIIWGGDNCPPRHCLESPREISKTQFYALINLNNSR